MRANNLVQTRGTAEALVVVGQAIRHQRKNQKVSAIAASEAAGISRVTLHRIEKGLPSVTAGAYMAVCAALNLRVEVLPQEASSTVSQPTPDRKGWIPARVRIADYPKLKELAWQVHGTPELMPREALDIYQRNWRHVDPQALSQQEKDLVDALRQGLGADFDV
jgi:transcriptional regulator with XRE-family HTH domain